MAIALRKNDELTKLRAANKIVGATLELLAAHTKPGVTLKELDALGEEYIRSQGAVPSFKGLYGFPSAVCTSVNEVIIHGIPTDYALQEGDIVGFDVGTQKNGYFGDAAISVGVGKISLEDEALIACSKDALYFAIETIQEGMRFKELSYEIEKFIIGRGFTPLRGFCGHGIGKKPHEEPEIPNYLDGGNAKQGPKIKNGMVFCLEPMICQKEGTSKILANGWDVVSTDGLRGSHYEHTVAIINGRAEILSIA
ncbi:MAG: type I methionyl aminopeptidase [Sulfuricurvum sp. GWF2_44_89]|uniref:Methionine aminopeptidase n=1 Tax=Sulfuricurvum kujiense TaxID=148813 RepID=A0A2D3W8H5_9BACT|nr:MULTISPECIES: type I methionyl aminopeptidase [Sulfuricurvum]OHD78432.1 MAG: type I methionyl aminopeptidase [Sulfuricurvum sp. GWF2_44_89]OHD90454.1 MAG: type I methionyl aminopeptidase [Sulfuricurvum sp. RIFOXYD12_FULL_44_77]OHD92088.1 MAG: type I methionyl aminopeptidase [Sulfuricurvum sp. RIFOXYD2_FULL_44_160]DAB37651.1 MAG TPA: type I methionyl aminopeptidase [Sulfuricurvum kujiense]